MKLIYTLWVCKKFHICAVKVTLKTKQAKEDNPLVFNLFARGKHKKGEKIAGYITIYIYFFHLNVIKVISFPK